MPTPAHELYIRCRTKTLDLLRRLPYTNTTAARGCSNQQEIEVTAATVRKNVRKWAAWAAAHPYPGGAGGVRAWVRTGVASVVGSRGPDLIYLALMGKELPPSWTPEGAAHRLERAVDHHPLTRAALAVSAADDLKIVSREAVARTAEAWWAWHDQAQARWSQTVEEAESRCALWVAGDSDDGPA